MKSTNAPTNAPAIASTKTPTNAATNAPTVVTATTNAPSSEPTDVPTNASLFITGVNYPELSDNLNESSFNESNGSSQTMISPAVASLAADDSTTAAPIGEQIRSPTSSTLANTSIIVLICIAALSCCVGVLVALTRRFRRSMQAKAAQHGQAEGSLPSDGDADDFCHSV
jgi:hypothetical protein